MYESSWVKFIVRTQSKWIDPVLIQFRTKWIEVWDRCGLNPDQVRTGLMWRCSKSQCRSLASSFIRFIFLWSGGVSPSFSSNRMICISIQVRHSRTVPRRLLALPIISAMVWFVQSYNQWERSLRIAIQFGSKNQCLRPDCFSSFTCIICTGSLCISCQLNFNQYDWSNLLFGSQKSYQLSFIAIKWFKELNSVKTDQNI